jgi:GT2 family glycosyltransferase
LSAGLARAAVVILHYGQARLTRRLYDQLLPESRALDVPVLVLDNAAPEPFEGAWRRLPDNRYWAGAFDYVVGAMRDMGRSHLWFCNNDVVFTARPPLLGWALARLARIEAAVGRVGLYSPAFAASPYHPQMVAKPGGDYRLARVLDGVAPLVSLDCLEALGGLDAADNPRGYGVDVWLAVRAYEAGWKLVVDHRLTLRHRHHTAAKAVPGFMEAAARAEDAYLTARLGPDYRERIRTWQAENTEAAGS